MDKTIFSTNFPITVYGNLENLTDVMSIGRVRIFYKYANRNGTYITDEFAEELIKTLPYTPVKGIYEEDDYTDHGASRDLGRIYGIVPGPQDMNFAWENHVDEDGVERVYACVNVYYYTALYEEAGKINGKGQSMELYKKSIKGDWKIIEGKQYYVFEKASFLGLQVLGDDVEPCFEGAAFFELYQSVKDLCDKLEKYQEEFQNRGEGGNTTMPSITFKISDSQKFDHLWTLLNTSFNEEAGWIVEYGICDVYDEYAVVRNYAEGTFERIYYTKDDETDSLSIDRREPCFIVDVNEAEYKVLRSLHSALGTYEAVEAKISELTAEVERISTENSEFSTKIGEQVAQIATLTSERDEAIALHTSVSAELETANATIEEVRGEFASATATATATITDLTAERDTLLAFQKNIFDTEKKNLISSYADKLSPETIQKYTDAMDNYTAEQLDKELTYELKRVGVDFFSQSVPPAYIPKVEEPSGGLASILAKYQK